ncbi:MAG: clostripain-related cysteine peptidase [candidate division WOR-3 bacterium]
MGSDLLKAVKTTGGWFFIPLLLMVHFAAGAQWTVGVYMCADNGMSEQAYDDLSEMMAVGSTSEVNIVVQIDNAERDTNPDCRRYYIKKERRELLANLGEVDMADTAVLSDFIRFLGERFPADNYFLIIWDHGNGWGAGYGPQRAVLIDESHGHMMGVAGGELRRALAQGTKRLGKRLTILGFDACLMSSIEVACEVFPYCDYLLASEALIPWDGFPYERFLSRLTARPTALPAEFLPEMCADYVAAHPFDDVCLSAVDMRQLERVLRLFPAVLSDSLDPRAPGFKLARLGVQTFPADAMSPPDVSDEQIDFIHLWELAPQTGTASLRSTLNPLIIANKVGGNLGNARGLATWFPYRYLGFKAKAAEYQTLVYADTVPWLPFLNTYFGLDDVKPTQPRLLSHRLGNRGDARLYWSRSYDLSPITYHLYQATQPVQVLLERCDSLGAWEADGWTISTRYAHSAPSALFSGSGPNLNSTLILREPLELTAGGLLSFYARYSTEETQDSLGNIRRDVCYVEFSPDRFSWQTLDSFYGSQESWQELRLLIPPTPRLFLRFRFQTNDAVNLLGVFIDDIRIERFASLRRALETKDTTGYLFNLARDTTGYYFMVMAIDSFGNRSNVSQFYPLKVKTWAEPYTKPAPFSDSCKLILDFPEDEKPDVFIYTLSGALVKRFPRVEAKEVFWNGRNEQGRELGDGVYLVMVQGKNFKKIGKIARVHTRR